MSRFAVLILLWFVATLVAAAQAPLLTEKDYQRISAAPANGFAYPYYLYVPPELKKAGKAEQTLLVYPNNTGKVSDDLGVHESDVKANMSRMGGIAAVLEVAILMPVFPRPESDWHTYTHALDRDTMLSEKDYGRLDLQLIAMIDDARKRLKKQGIAIDKRVFMSGFSAQAMFTNRFTFLHPDRVKAACIGSPGGWPIAPVEKYNDKSLRYPIGVADLKAVSGKKFDLEELKRVPLFIFIGDQDTNDSVPFDDSYDQEDRDLINPLFGETPVSRWSVSQELYKKAGLDATFRVYPGVAHTITPEMRDDIRAFFLKHK